MKIAVCDDDLIFQRQIKEELDEKSTRWLELSEIEKIK